MGPGNGQILGRAYCAVLPVPRSPFPVAQNPLSKYQRRVLSLVHIYRRIGRIPDLGGQRARREFGQGAAGLGRAGVVNEFQA